MRKKIIALFVFSVMGALVFAEAEPNYGAETSIGNDSILSEVTYGLFSNELDAAMSVETQLSGVSFNDLSQSYLFAGITSNLQFLTGDDTGEQFALGYFHNGEELPWAVFFDANLSEADVDTYNTEIDNPDGNTVTSDIISYGTIDFGLDFLTVLGKFNLGLDVDVELVDNRETGSNSITTDNSTGYETVATDMNGSTALAEVSLPLYFESEKFNSYGVFSYEYYQEDSSTSSSDESITTDENTEDVYRVNTVDFFYKLTLPIKERPLSLYADLAIGSISRDTEYSDNEDSTNDYTIERDYASDINFEVGAEYYMELQSTSWMNFRARPNVSYQYTSAGYLISEVQKFNDGITDDYYSYSSDAETSEKIHYAKLGLDTGLEIKPPTWFMGVMLGSSIEFSYKSTTSVDNTSYVEDTDGDGEDDTTDDSGSDTETSYAWASDIETSLGVFFEFPDDYRLDVFLTNDELSFESLSVQLIVPLS